MSNALSQRSTVPVGKAAAATIAWQFKGELRLTVVVKASFAFAPDAPMTRVDPQPIARAAVHHGRNPLRSVQTPSDLIPFRKRADVLFTGAAHAPSGRAVESMTVRLGVSDGARMLVDKSLLVRKQGGFRRIPIDYDHARGGPGHPENPTGEEEGSDDLNIFDPVDPARVAGFGPLSETMLSRKRLLGPLPLPPFGLDVVRIPDAFDFDFFQVAPADQRIDLLRGDEWILLENLHPTRSMLRTRLPGARAVARIHGLSDFRVQEGRPLAMAADTLMVSGDEERCTVTWRGSFAIASEAALGAVRIAAGVELPGEPIVWPDPAALATMAAASAPAPAQPPATDRTLALSDDDLEVVSSSGAAGETLPIASSTAKAPRPDPLPFRPDVGAQPVIAFAPPRRAPSRGSAGETLPIDSSTAKAPRRDPLPFRAKHAVTMGGSHASQSSAQAHAPPPEPPDQPVPEAAPRQEPPAAPAPPAQQAASDASPPAKESPAKESPWAPAPPAPPAAPRQPPQQKMPPKVDIKNKLYGSKKG